MASATSTRLEGMRSACEAQARRFDTRAFIDAMQVQVRRAAEGKRTRLGRPGAASGSRGVVLYRRSTMGSRTHVVILNGNGRRYVRDRLDSIFAQTYRDA